MIHRPKRMELDSESNTMHLPIYHIDAFANRPFEGNPAAVCPLEAWLTDDLLQAIAMENNLSETAFFVSHRGHYQLRWLTPTVEVDLCGHATLATAHLILERLSPELQQVAFETRSGTLQVHRAGDSLAMDFPRLDPGPSIEIPSDLVAAMGATPAECRPIREVHGAPYVLLVYESETQIAKLAPRISSLGANVIATAPGDSVDFVSRFFAPLSGVAEDPVTGSAHCTLTPYWADRLGKADLSARQISARGGDVGCRVDGDRVILTGRCVLYLEGKIHLPIQP